jgi:hypothetical protein
MNTSPLAISSLKYASIIIWNVAGELVKPKNMTFSSKSPLFVLNAALGWSPSLIRTLLYPHRISNLVNQSASRIWAMISLINGMISSAFGTEEGEVFYRLTDWLGSRDPLTPYNTRMAHRFGLDD